MISNVTPTLVGMVAVLALCSAPTVAFPFSGGSMFMPPPWHRRPMNDHRRSPLDQLHEMMESQRLQKQARYPWMMIQPAQRQNAMVDGSNYNNLQETDAPPTQHQPEIQTHASEPIATQESDVTEQEKSNTRKYHEETITSNNIQVPPIDAHFRTGKVQNGLSTNTNEGGAVREPAQPNEEHVDGPSSTAGAQEDDDAIAAAIAREVLDESTHVPGYRDEWASPETSGKGRVDLVRMPVHRKLQPFSAQPPNAHVDDINTNKQPQAHDDITPTTAEQS